jgi:hypothetical protein
VAITGFFTPASTSNDRTEKINLGITTLLAMSILMLMVSDQMPTTSVSNRHDHDDRYWTITGLCSTYCMVLSIDHHHHIDWNISYKFNSTDSRT